MYVWIVSKWRTSDSEIWLQNLLTIVSHNLIDLSKARERWPLVKYIPPNLLTHLIHNLARHLICLILSPVCTSSWTKTVSFLTITKFAACFANINWAILSQVLFKPDCCSNRKATFRVTQLSSHYRALRWDNTMQIRTSVLGSSRYTNTARDARDLKCNHYSKQQKAPSAFQQSRVTVVPSIHLAADSPPAYRVGYIRLTREGALLRR